MKLKIILLALLFPSIIAYAQGKYHIDGILNNDYNGKYVKLFQFQGDTLITSIDSAKVENGKFYFEGAPRINDFAIVTIGNYPYIKSLEIILEEGHIKAYMDTAFVASGTYLNDLHNTLDAEFKRVYHKWFNLTTNGGAVDIEREKAYDELQKFIYNSTIENRSTVVGRRFIRDHKSSIFTLENMVKLHDQLEALEKNNSLVTQKDIDDLSNFIARNKEYTERQTKMNNTQYVDFELQDTLGAKKRIAQYVGKSRLLFIDFWASWCSPCRAEIPHIKDIYQKYKNKGLNVLTISFDTNLTSWRNALKKLDMPWSQLIEIKGMGSALSQAYQISGIPYGILIDAKGTIVAAGIGSAEGLEKAILKQQ
jgi:Thiol-disulfide isomerase and thioredoxins